MVTFESWNEIRRQSVVRLCLVSECINNYHVSIVNRRISEETITLFIFFFCPFIDVCVCIGFQIGGGWTPVAGGDTVSGTTGKQHRMAVLVRKSAPGSPTPSSASSYGTASPGNDLIASASSALRRLHFKSAGAQRMLNRSKQQQQQSQSQQSSPVPKLKVLGSSSVSVESSATVNTSTDSSAATMTTVTDTEDSVDNPVVSER